MLDPYFKHKVSPQACEESNLWHLYLQKILHDAEMILFHCEEEKILAGSRSPDTGTRDGCAIRNIRTGVRHRVCCRRVPLRWPRLRGKRWRSQWAGSIRRKLSIHSLRHLASTLAKILHESGHRGPDEVGWQRNWNASDQLRITIESPGREC